MLRIRHNFQVQTIVAQKKGVLPSLLRFLADKLTRFQEAHDLPTVQFRLQHLAIRQVTIDFSMTGVVEGYCTIQKRARVFDNGGATRLIV